MAAIIGDAARELELELENELLGELAHEGAHEHAHEGEDEMFFNHLAAMADRGGRSQALRRIALAAARSALKGRKQPAGIEGEFEFEATPGLELEWNPTRRVYIDAQMEHIGHAAAEAETEQEAAEHFLPLIPLAAKFALPFAMKALPMAAKFGGALAKKFAPKLISKVAPQLTRGVSNIARTLFRNPTSRRLLHAVPRIGRQTMSDVLRQYARTGRMDPQTALRLLARRTANTISNPRLLAQNYQRSVKADRRYHQGARQILGTPVGGGVRANPALTIAPSHAACPTCGR